MAIKKIMIGKLKVGMVLASPVFIERRGRNVLLMNENTYIASEHQIGRLIEGEVKFVEIDTDKGADTFTSLDKTKKWDDIKTEKKDVKAMDSLLSRHVNNFISSVTNTIMKNPLSRNLINEEPASSIIKELIVFVESNTDVLLALIRLKGANEYTFTHAVNSTVLCISLAGTLGFKYKDIVRFAKGTFLADIGMTSFPSRMIARPSGLSNKEIDEIKKHPIFAVDFLKKVGIEDNLIELIIVQHHERFDGSGYPYGLEGDDIHPVTKLFSIVDVYVAMTSSRPHRAGIPPYIVLGEIHKLSGTHFDPRMKDFFIKQLGVFPVGSLVELTTGHVAIVAQQNKAEPLKPTAIVFPKKKKLSSGGGGISAKQDIIAMARGSWEVMDLAKADDSIGRVRRGLDHREYNMTPSTYLLQI
ncbi:HD-GYP domain-containing protein [Candidatus Latescibacterota bacterium]